MFARKLTAALALGTRKSLGAAGVLRAELYDQQVLMVAAAPGEPSWNNGKRT